MSDILAGANLRHTAQTSRAREDQVVNSAGGYVFEVTDAVRLRRFLILGTTGGTFYASAKDLTAENAEFLVKLCETDHALVRNLILDVSLSGAAPKQNQTIFALAIACSYGSDEDRAEALALVPQVCRIGTHLFLFAKYVQQFRGWGRGLRRAVAGWYTSKDVDKLAYQVVKYRSREGFTHRDLLRLSHPSSIDPALQATFKWIVDGSAGEATPRLIEGFLKAQGETSMSLARVVREYKLSWEMLPDDALGHREIWEALLDVGVPQTALMRQLPRLTNLGIVGRNIEGRTQEVAALLSNQERLTKSRVHPMSVLVAHKTYAQGYSERGSTTWTPSPAIVDALDDAFYASFGNVKPSGKKTLVALDVSGSMGFSSIAGLPLTPREASAAMALVTLATEPASDVVAFTGRGYGFRSDTKLMELDISPKMRLANVVRKISSLPFGATDCSLPAQWAVKRGLPYETIQIMTDNETWAGASVQPYQALRDMRAHFDVPVRQVVMGMTATNFTIADPRDPLSLDVVGLDAGVPNLVSSFARGEI